MQQITVAVIGCGGRGHFYSSFMAKNPDKFRITALCDINPKQLEKMHRIPSLCDTQDFLDPDAFFLEKRADCLVISTPDRLHVPMALKALELGYHLLLEKPISDDRAELKALVDMQKKTGKHIVICHELRYGAGYQKCAELLRSGAIGQLNVIDASERAVYWHWAQAYVRGIGASLDDGHPCILAKCSHDLDLVQFYAGSRCKSVTSVGDLRFFKPENAPEGAAERCLDCKHVDTCPYSAKRIYIDQWHEKGEPTFTWPYNKVTLQDPLTEEAICEGIRTSEYGRCAFRCPVDQVDHQLVQMEFENGVKASLKMVYSYEMGRRIIFYGTLGEIVFDEREDSIVLLPYGRPKQTISLQTLVEGGHGHGGGDQKLVLALYDVLTGREAGETGILNSVEAHLMGIAAEESRARGGALISVHTDEL